MRIYRAGIRPSVGFKCAEADQKENAQDIGGDGERRAEGGKDGSDKKKHLYCWGRYARPTEGKGGGVKGLNERQVRRKGEIRDPRAPIRENQN